MNDGGWVQYAVLFFSLYLKIWEVNAALSGLQHLFVECLRNDGSPSETRRPSWFVVFKSEAMQTARRLLSPHFTPT